MNTPLTFKSIFYFITALFSYTNLFAADYYWVSGTGNWSDFANHWATTSGGSTLHNSVPGPNDNTIFNSQSFSAPGQSVTIDVSTANCNDITWTGVTNTPELKGGSFNPLYIYGSLTLDSNMILSYSGEIIFSATTSGNTIFSAGITFPGTSYFKFDGIGGGWTLLDALYAPNVRLSIDNGTFRSGNQTITCGEFLSWTPNFRAVYLGTSSVFVTGYTWSAGIGTPIHDFDSATVQISSNFTGGGFYYHKLIINGNAVINSSNTFDSLIIYPGKTASFEPGQTQTVLQHFGITGTGAENIQLKSNVNGSKSYLYKNGGQVCGDFLVITDMDASGAMFYAGGNSTDNGNNTGWIFACCMSIKPVLSQSGMITLCQGDSITIDAGSGYTGYLWSDGSTTQTITRSVAGNYFCEILDDSCYGYTDTLNLLFHPQPSVNITLTGTLNFCEGDSVILTASINESYLWSTGDTTQSITVDTSGIYAVMVTDSNSCSATASDTAVQLPPLFVTINKTDICNGLCNGTTTAIATGGTPLYTYLWSSSSSQSAVSNLCQGSYYLTVTDANGCTITDSSSVTEPPALSVAITATDMSCYALCNGSVTAGVSGGTPPYSYSWSEMSTTSSVGLLCQGNYAVTVTDDNGCSDSANASVARPPQLTISTSDTNVTCYGLCDGASAALAAGGVMPYTYQWSTAESTPAISGLCSGSYFITLSDTNGCTVTTSSFINEPLLLTLTLFPTDAGCNGVCDGKVGSTLSGGTPPYSYSWSNGATSSSLKNLCAGNYFLTFSDGNSCIIIDSATVAEPDTMTAAVTATAATCNGGSDGTATVAPAGGSSFYNYLWSNGETQSAITNLQSAIYTVTVNDLNCNESVPISISVNEPIPFSLLFSKSDAICGNADGSVSVAVTGSTPPYNYLWDDPGSSTNDSVEFLFARLYTVTITDAVGCTLVGSVAVSNFGAATVTIDSIYDAGCYGESNGAVFISSTGSGPFTYNWTNGAATQDISGISPGNYFVSVTDGNTCLTIATAIVNQPALLTAAAAATAASCNGTADGSATVTASGGTPPYVYVWNDPLMQSGDSAINLTANTYSVTVTDTNGCTITVNTVIAQPPVLTAAATATAASCNGVTDGKTDAIADGGTPPYNYLWSDSTATNTADNLSAGNYTVTVTDVNGCDTTASATVNQPFPLSAAATAIAVSCNNGSNGSTDLTVSGGVGGFAFLWSTGDTIEDLTGLSPDTFMVLVVDSACGDSIITSAVVSEPLPVLTSPLIANVSCNGFGDGSITAGAGGGTVPYTYLWNDSLAQTTDPAVNLVPGIYVVIINDSNGCSLSDTITISQPDSLVLTLASSDVICNGNSDGWAYADVSGGTPPYVYQWNDSLLQINDTAFSLPGAMVTVVISDGNGCVISDSILIGEPTALTTATVATSTSCYGASDGSAIATAGGGTPPYGYVWSDSLMQINDTAYSLAGGNYSVTVTDANGCIIIMSVLVADPFPLTTIISAADVSCNGLSDGWAYATINGGTSPYNYLWDDLMMQTGDTAYNLLSGMYHVTVTDTNGCVKSDSVFIESPFQLSVTITPANASCNGACDGNATVNVTGGTPPYTYSSLSNLCAGTYLVPVIDSNGCMVTDSVNISEPFLLAVSISALSASCNGNCDGMATANITGGTPPYTYSWNDPNSQTNSTAFSLCTGIYINQITDTNGCMVTDTFTLNEPMPLVIDSITISKASCGSCPDGDATVYPSGGTPPYTYLWNDSLAQATATATGLSPAYYTACVTDSNGCTICDSINVDFIVNEKPNTVLPVSRFGFQVFPNPAFEGKFKLAITLPEKDNYSIEITNAIGQRVFSENLNNFSGNYLQEFDLFEFGGGVYSVHVIGSKVSSVARVVVL